MRRCPRADSLVVAALESKNRRVELRDEVDHPARPSVEADRSGEGRGRTQPQPTSRCPPETEADGEDRVGAHRTQVRDAQVPTSVCTCSIVNCWTRGM